MEGSRGVHLYTRNHTQGFITQITTILVATFGKVKLSLCIIKHHTVTMYGGVETHEFLTSAPKVVIYISWPREPLGHGKNPQYRSEWRLDGPPQPVWTLSREKCLALPGIEPRFLVYLARSLAKTPTELSRILFSQISGGYFVFTTLLIASNVTGPILPVVCL